MKQENSLEPLAVELNAAFDAVVRDFPGIELKTEHFSGSIVATFRLGDTLVELACLLRRPEYGVSLIDENTLPFTGHDHVGTSLKDAFDEVRRLLRNTVG